MPPCGQWNSSKLESASVPEFTLNEENNGQSIEIPLGARLNIYLKENPTTGYRWSVREPGSGSLRLESADYAPGRGVGVGGAGIRKFVFISEAPGTATINLVKIRQWEPEGVATATFTALVTVKGAH
jgi:inhibitor of cysteine peptidase